LSPVRERPDGRFPARCGRTAAIAAAVGAAAYWSPALSSVVPLLRAPLGILDHIPDPGRVALTFDDGPHPQGTPAVLEWLAQADARATFFLVGEQVERWPELAVAVAAAGHTIGLHAYRHDLVPRLGPWRLRRDLETAARVLHEVTGQQMRFCRAPHGIPTTSDLVLAREHGRTLVHWSRWGKDWMARATAESIASTVVRDLRGGDIVLLHDADHYSAPDSWRRTLAALPMIGEVMKRRGLGFAALR
jgi:peptidoglycan/xylan/chitin deacetylase (PgdA/CDA1 family)